MAKLISAEKAAQLREKARQAEKAERARHRAALLYRIDVTYEKIELIEEIKKVFQQFNGKIFNKRLVEALDAVPGIYSYKRVYWKCTAIEIRLASYETDDVKQIAYLSIQDKRIDAESYIKKLDNITESFQNQIKSWKNDLETGEERFKKFLELRTEMKTLARTFSRKFIDQHSYEFKCDFRYMGI